MTEKIILEGLFGLTVSKTDSNLWHVEGSGCMPEWDASHSKLIQIAEIRITTRYGSVQVAVEVASVWAINNDIKLKEASPLPRIAEAVKAGWEG